MLLTDIAGGGTVGLALASLCVEPGAAILQEEIASDRYYLGFPAILLLLSV